MDKFKSSYPGFPSLCTFGLLHPCARAPCAWRIRTERHNNAILKTTTLADTSDFNSKVRRSPIEENLSFGTADSAEGHQATTSDHNCENVMPRLVSDITRDSVAATGTSEGSRFAAIQAVRASVGPAQHAFDSHHNKCWKSSSFIFRSAAVQNKVRSRHSRRMVPINRSTKG